MASSRKLLPICMSFPSIAISGNLPYSIWNECLQIWIATLRAYLSTPLHELEQTPPQHASLVNLLVSYVYQTSGTRSSYQGQETDDFRRLIFLNAHRLILGSDSPPSALLTWTFLADLWETFDRNEASCTLIASAYSMHDQEVNASLSEIKNRLTSSLESKNFEIFLALDFNHRLLPLVRSVPAIGTYFVTGSDFMNASISSYAYAIPPVQSRLLILFYFGLSALAKGDRLHQSQLIDILYLLKSSIAVATAFPKEGHHLMYDLATKTPLLTIVNRRLSRHQTGRAKTILDSLRPLQQVSPAWNKSRHVEQTSALAFDTKNEEQLSDPDRVSLISHIQDLFPDLSSAFVLTLLEHYNNNIEIITTSLLDGSLPPYLRSLQFAERQPNPVSHSAYGKHATRQHRQIEQNQKHNGQEHSQKGATMDVSLRERRNYYDHDALDTLSISKGQLYYGKRAHEDTADGTLSAVAERKGLKAAIMSALSSFDANDDEHDDTYDTEDVGGTVDLTTDSPSREHIDDVEEVLYRAWAATGGQELFARNSATRKSVKRQNLRRESNMTDEAIEGWALMLAREPRRLRRLERIFSDKMLSQPQAKLESTKWRAPEQDEDDGGAEHAHIARTRAHGQGLGDHYPGEVASSTADTSTQLARQRKDADKGRRANHNRRNQRAKKMARGGFPS